MADKYANIAALTEFLSQIKAWANATFSPKFVILSYGNSTWADYIDAYSNNKVVYCRASSGSNPASGSQTRLAFMAYVNNAEAPTEVEFQYYRSVNSHSASQQGDQVFVYKLTKTGGWTVTTREAMSKIATEKGLDSTYSSGTIKLKTKLKAESQSSLTAVDKGSTADREYAVGLDASGNLSVNIPWTGTITGITMNGTSKGTSGVVDLGTVITSHQDISGKQDKITPITAQTTQAVYPIKIDAQGHITAYGSAVTIPAAVAVKGNAESSYRTGNVNLTPANIGAATSSHTHGNIQNGGTLQTNDVAIANGDKLVVTDSSDSAKVARTSLTFDGSTTTQFLSKKGTWETASGDITHDTTAEAGSAVTLNADQLQGYNLNQLMKLLYPVGAIYQNTSNVNPANFITGTTWTLRSSVALASEHVFGNDYNLGLTDGTYTAALIFSTTHDIGEASGAYGVQSPAGTGGSGYAAFSQGTGLGVATKAITENHPEYSGLIADTITVYTWERTA